MSVTKCLALEIECVGVEGGKSEVARVSVVNENLECVLDTYVAPTQRVIDYRTQINGIRSYDLVGAPNISDIREKVKEMISGEGCILVGHRLQNHLKALNLTHPYSSKRDISSYPPFLKMNRNKKLSLHRLADMILQKSIKNGEQSSVEKAKAVMEIFKTVEQTWESGFYDTDSDSDSYCSDSYYYYSS